MIQSNMKRSEDIQQSLSSGRFFASVSKKNDSNSRKSSLSNQSNSVKGGADIISFQNPQNESVHEYQTLSQQHAQEPPTLIASPKVIREKSSKNPLLLQQTSDDFGISESVNAQVPLSQSKTPSPSKPTTGQQKAPQSQNFFSNQNRPDVPATVESKPLSPVG